MFGFDDLLTYGGMLILNDALTDDPPAPVFDHRALEEGIQLRVEDAKKAGINPLYALGANFGSASVAYQPDKDAGKRDILSNSYQALLRKQFAKRDDMETRLMHEDIALKRMTSEQIRSQTRYYDALREKIMSETARANQNMNSSQDYGMQDQVIDPRPRGTKNPKGRLQKAGPGSPSQVREDEYGEMSIFDDIPRYLRDVTIPEWEDVLYDWANDELELSPGVGDRYPASRPPIRIYP